MQIFTGHTRLGRRNSPPANECIICFNLIENEGFANECLHRFCRDCLFGWTKEKNECPICRKTFTTIIHNVKSDNDYEEMHVYENNQENNEESNLQSNMDFD